MSDSHATTKAIEAHVLGHAQRVGDEIGFWRVPVPAGEPLTRVFIYAHDRGHWHYVSEGLWSSGIELTLRVARDGDTPPTAPMDRLREIARNAITYRQLPRPMDSSVTDPLAPESKLTALAFVPDTELPALDIAGKSLAFLQCVGLTEREARTCVRVSTGSVIARLAAIDPFLVTRYDRAELGDLPTETAALPVSRGHTVPTLRWQRDGNRYSVSIEPTRMRPTFAEHLVSRVGGGEFFRVSGPERVLRVEPGSTSSAEEVMFEGRPTLLVRLDAAALAEVTRGAATTEALCVGPCDVHFVDEP